MDGFVYSMLPGQQLTYASSSAHSCLPGPPPYEIAGRSSPSAACSTVPPAGGGEGESFLSTMTGKHTPSPKIVFRIRYVYTVMGERHLCVEV